MTETEWLACADPHWMLQFLRGKVSDRKLRLFAVSCCRRIGHHFDEPCRGALAVAERFADGQATRVELETAGAVAVRARMRGDPPAERATWALAVVHTCDATDMLLHARQAADTAATLAAVGTPASFREGARILARRTQSRLLRDIVGNPHRPVAIDPAWVTWMDQTVPRFAQSIYDERAFDQLPILADALEDAGCTNEDVLRHCRSGGEHIRGCWVVDLLLGKT